MPRRIRGLVSSGSAIVAPLTVAGVKPRTTDTHAAIARAVGVHSPQGQEELSYHWRDRDKPATPQSSLGPLLGQGLMVTGQSGALRALGPAGNAVAQTWNALLAAIGTADYNQRARARPDSLVLRPPSWPHLRAAP